MNAEKPILDLKTTDIFQSEQDFGVFSRLFCITYLHSAKIMVSLTPPSTLTRETLRTDSASARHNAECQTDRE